MELLEKLKEAIINGDEKKTRILTKDLINKGIDVQEIIDKGLKHALDTVGNKFANGEYFLTDLMLSASAASSCFNLLKPLFKKVKTEFLGRIVIGTVEGDIHDIGKNIVIAMLRAIGFDVIDLGVDVSPKKFLDAIVKYSPQILGMSALLSTTMPAMERTINLIKDNKLRDKIKIMVGGGPITEDYARKIGADGYGKDASDAQVLAKKFIEE
jgi:5-methyltetrahydrofolate--homocysteine methyltransferase